MGELHYTLPAPLEIPQVAALDWDRTLGDVDAAMQRLYIAAKAEGLDTEQIQAERERTENDGGSFDPLTFVKNSLGEESYDSSLATSST
jgi:hypothetical protein